MAIKTNQNEEADKPKTEKTQPVENDTPKPTLESKVEVKKEQTKEPVVEPEAEPQAEPQTLTPELLELFRQMQSKIEALEKKQTEKPREVKKEYDMDELRDDDFLREPAVYYCYSSRYAIWGDKRKGQNVSTPYSRPFIFRSIIRHTQPSKSGRGQEVISVSRCEVLTRREDEFLKTHTLYGIKFFRNMKDVNDSEIHLAERMLEFAGMVKNLNDQQVVLRCKREGVSQSPDIDSMRSALIKRLAENAEQDAKKRKIHKLEKAVESRESIPQRNSTADAFS